jgi:cyclic beta-1,2-glucan synthetase
MDIMLNRWLLYQTLSCRMWARCGFYQASGATDSATSCRTGWRCALTQPAIAREHLLRAAARQFVEGDVQHWWLPASGEGVRTRISDDPHLAAYACAHHVEVDRRRLDARRAGFRSCEAARSPPTSTRRSSGRNGTGDGARCSSTAREASMQPRHRRSWPALDRHGRLERRHEPGRRTRRWGSVWLGGSCARRSRRSRLWRRRAGKPRVPRRGSRTLPRLRSAIERTVGTATGTGAATSTTGRHSARPRPRNAGSIRLRNPGALLSARADPARARHAMTAMETHLVRAEDRLALLLAPPFDRTPLDPGYIRGYPPGIRENGRSVHARGDWSISLSPPSDRARKPPRCSEWRIRSSAAARGPTCSATKVEPYAVAADVYLHGAARRAAADGPGTPVRRAGSIEPGSRPSWASAARRVPVPAPCIPAEWPGFEVDFAFRSARTRSVVVNQGRRPSSLPRGTRRRSGVTAPVRIPLVDDGRTHRFA